MQDHFLQINDSKQKTSGTRVMINIDYYVYVDFNHQVTEQIFLKAAVSVEVTDLNLHCTGN